MCATAFGLAMACTSRPPETRAPEELDIVYSVERKNPPARFVLHVPARGTAKLTLNRAPAAQPTGAAGYFAVRPTSEERASIERQIETHSLLSRHDEPDLSERGGGLFELRRGTGRAAISLGTGDEGARGLGLLLDGLAARATGRPLAAVELEAHARADGPRARFDISLRHRGIRPLDVAVLPERDPGAVLRLRLMLERKGKLVNELTSSPDDLRRLLREPWHRIEPKTTWRLPPLAMPLPADESGLFARVEASLRVKTERQPAIDIELTSASMSLGADEER